MAKASPAITAFNAGELSPLVDARVEKDWYRYGCKELTNFIPLVQGPAMRDPGTYFAAEVKDSADRTWFARFEFNAYEAYVIEVGDQYMRFYTDRGRLTVTSVTAWSNATAYVVGDLASRLGVNYYCIAAHTNQQPPNATYWYPLTSDIYEIPTPWAIADLTGLDGEFMLDVAQVGDVMYITHKGGDYEPVKISRYSDTNWVLEYLFSDEIIVDGPFKDTNEDTGITIYASANTGSVTITASALTFEATHVGSLIYLERNLVDDIKVWEAGKSVSINDIRRSNGKNYIALNTGTTGTVQPNHNEGAVYDGSAGIAWEFQDSGFGVARITGYTSGTVVTAEVLSRIPDGAVGSGQATHRWALGMFSEAEGWPTHVCFFRERLTFRKGQELAGSVSGDYESFAKYNDGGLVTIEQAWRARIAVGNADEIKWIYPGQAGLLIGTTGAELVLGELTTNIPFGPGNIKAEAKSSYGSRGVKPVGVDNSTIFVQRSGRQVRNISLTFDGYKSGDLSARNDQIAIPGVVSMAYQREPWSIVWCVLANGELIGLTYNEEQEVIGWHRHTLGGVFGTGNAVVEAVEVIPAPLNNRDDVWLIVKRTINGGTKRYVEYMVPEYQTGDAATSPFYVRCGATYDGAATTTVTGLSHLEGQTVQVLADGSTHPDCVVSSGTITLQRSASVVHVGLKYRSTLRTMRLEAGAEDGTAQGKVKRVTKAVIRFFNTLGAKAGPSISKLDTLTFRTGSDPMDAPPPIFTGDKNVPWPSGYETDAHLAIVQDDPLPMTVVGIFPQVTTQD